MELIMLIVLAATCYQVFGIPIDDKSDIQQSISNKKLSNTERVNLTLPTVIHDKFVIQVNGTLNALQDRFKVVLTDAQGTGNCDITHDFNENKLKVTPANKDQVADISITRDSGYEFSLKLTARKSNNFEMLEVLYEVIAVSQNAEFHCDVRFDELSYIVFESMEMLHSILFNF